MQDQSNNETLFARTGTSHAAEPSVIRITVTPKHDKYSSLIGSAKFGRVVFQATVSDGRKQAVYVFAMFGSWHYFSEKS